ncbi:MAG: polyprenyl diphosphate synthase [Treponema sp.]|nr:polyprenyl diphosphate synthase [Treponema sp.]
MDGNGRWAEKRGLLRTQGHLEGIQAAKRVVKAASDLGLSYLTLYTFSTENWKRAAGEVGFVMGLVKKHLRAELDFYRENRIRVRHAGSREGLSPEILDELDGVFNDTKDFAGLQVIIALNYGGRDEIVRAVKKLAAAKEDITEESIGRYLDNPDVPGPDLVIRTAGEFRISNFLLWESAYAEYYISGKLWPDWSGEDLALAVQDYHNRERRFGAAPGGEKMEDGGSRK